MSEDVLTITSDAHFDKLLSTHPEMKRQLRKVITQVLNKARTQVQGAARNAIDNDPRAAYKAVKRMVYKKILGGNISLLTPRRAGNRSYVPDATQVRTGRGGNRIPRSRDTERMMSYYGEDRGFVLRWINSGTKERSSRYGNRGHISASGWFETSSQQAIESAVNQLSAIIDKTIQDTQV